MKYYVKDNTIYIKYLSTLDGKQKTMQFDINTDKEFLRKLFTEKREEAQVFMLDDILREQTKPTGEKIEYSSVLNLVKPSTSKQEQENYQYYDMKYKEAKDTFEKYKERIKKGELDKKDKNVELEYKKLRKYVKYYKSLRDKNLATKHDFIDVEDFELDDEDKKVEKMTKILNKTYDELTKYQQANLVAFFNEIKNQLNQAQQEVIIEFIDKKGKDRQPLFKLFKKLGFNEEEGKYYIDKFIKILSKESEKKDEIIKRQDKIIIGKDKIIEHQQKPEYYTKKTQNLNFETTYNLVNQLLINYFKDFNTNIVVPNFNDFIKNFDENSKNYYINLLNNLSNLIDDKFRDNDRDYVYYTEEKIYDTTGYRQTNGIPIEAPPGNNKVLYLYKILLNKSHQKKNQELINKFENKNITIRTFIETLRNLLDDLVTHLTNYKDKDINPEIIKDSFDDLIEFEKECEANMGLEKKSSNLTSNGNLEEFIKDIDKNKTFIFSAKEQCDKVLGMIENKENKVINIVCSPKKSTREMFLANEGSEDIYDDEKKIIRIYIPPIYNIYATTAMVQTEIKTTKANENGWEIKDLKDFISKLRNILDNLAKSIEAGGAGLKDKIKSSLTSDINKKINMLIDKVNDLTNNYINFKENIKEEIRELKKSKPKQDIIIPSKPPEIKPEIKPRIEPKKEVKQQPTDILDMIKNFSKDKLKKTEQQKYIPDDKPTQLEETFKKRREAFDEDEEDEEDDFDWDD